MSVLRNRRSQVRILTGALEKALLRPGFSLLVPAEWAGEEALVFPSLEGTPLMVENLRRRVLRPAAEEAGAPWAGFHSFRHTCASMLFDRGKSAKQVQTWLGHHSPSFTVDAYVHLLRDGPGEPLSLSAELTAPYIVGGAIGHEGVNA